MTGNAIKVGWKAPDFELNDQDEGKFKLSDLRGRKVVLSFHPLAWTGVCAKQMLSLEANFDEFGKLNAVAVGVNVDSVPSKKAWADSLGISRTRLLSDFWPHGDVARKLGIFREKDGFSERANIIIDAGGKIAFVKIYPIGELPDVREIITKLREMG